MINYKPSQFSEIFNKTSYIEIMSLFLSDPKQAYHRVDFSNILGFCGGTISAILNKLILQNFITVSQEPREMKKYKLNREDKQVKILMKVYKDINETKK